MHQHLLNWHKPLIAIGAFFLVVGGVVAVLIIVYKCLSKFYVSCENIGNSSVKFGKLLYKVHIYFVLCYVAVPSAPILRVGLPF